VPGTTSLSDTEMFLYQIGGLSETEHLRRRRRYPKERGVQRRFGAMAIIRYAQRHGSKRPWPTVRSPAYKVAAVALANKNAQMA